MGRANSISLMDCYSRKKHCVDSVGGICDLPDSILGHVLSFLPTKNAVATRILSQRWKFLWTTVNKLDFDCRRSDGVDRFVEFVNYVLLLHNPGCLNEFTLAWGIGCMPLYVNAWVSTAVARNVRKLILSVGISKLSIHVQRSMFSCESLRSLELNLNEALCISQEIAFSLPKLESLKLFSVIFESEETLCKLLGGCPVLEYLLINIDIVGTEKICHLDNGTMFRCIISSPSLRRLELSADDEHRCWCYMSICGVQLDAPSLKSVTLEQISSISIRQSPVFLVKANIQLVDRTIDDQDHYNSVVEAFRAIECAKKLVLNHKVIIAFERATIETKPIFNNLTRLEVTNDFIHWSSLHHFLLLSDNLEVFIVSKEFDDSYRSEDDTENVTNPIPRCLSSSLRFVSIGGYDGDEDEFAMISYILKHGSVLQLMEIPIYAHDLEEGRELIQKICMLPKKSRVCEVQFMSDECKIPQS